MSFLDRLVREPLVHFLVIGAAIFALAARYGGGQETTSRDRIVVTEGRVQQLAQIFTKTWQRPPSAQELSGLVESHIREEVYYREALKLGLDRDDTVIRRRMQQKMEFLTEPSEDTLAATDAELEAYLADNRVRYRAEAEIAFEQIFLNPQGSEESVETRVGELLKAANDAQSVSDLRRLGDPTLLPGDMPLTSISVMDRHFGNGFGERMVQVPLNVWSGPVQSAYGLHLVRVTERRDGYDPPLAKVRAAVERDWRNAKRDTFRTSEYERLRGKYEIVLPDGSGEHAKAKLAQ